MRHVGHLPRRINCVYYQRSMYPEVYEARSEFNVIKTAYPTA
jgi:hypothetical protein